MKKGKAASSYREPLPIVGWGAVCAVGANVESACEALVDGVDGLRPLPEFSGKQRTPPLCAFVSVELDAEAPNRTTALALLAAEQALAHAPIVASGLRIGMVFATTVAGMNRSEFFFRHVISDRNAMVEAARELSFHDPGACAGWLCSHLGLHGFHTLSTACSTGLHAIGFAKRLVETGRYDACCAIGAEALSALTVAGFTSLLLIDPNGCRPFDRRRAGTSLGEGAAALLIASDVATQRLGLTPIAYVAGWGASADGYHMTAPDPQARGAIVAIEAAMEEANISADQVDLIFSHGTGTPDNDAAEAKAMLAVFGSQLPPFCSMKRTVGHTLAASGTLESALAIACLLRGVIPPTVGHGEADEALGVAPATPTTGKNIRCILKNAFGFGGNNAAAIFTAGDFL